MILPIQVCAHSQPSSFWPCRALAASLARHPAAALRVTSCLCLCLCRLCFYCCCCCCCRIYSRASPLAAPSTAKRTPSRLLTSGPHLVHLFRSAPPSPSPEPTEASLTFVAVFSLWALRHLFALTYLLTIVLGVGVLGRREWPSRLRHLRPDGWESSLARARAAAEKAEKREGERERQKEKRRRRKKRQRLPTSSGREHGPDLLSPSVSRHPPLSQDSGLLEPISITPNR